MPTQAEKAYAFRALHQRPGAFIIPNPWDTGSARMLAQCGFEALASTSGGAAFAAGRGDGGLGRAAVLQHLTALAAATDLPVSADLENGYGDVPDDVAATISLAAATGIVGGSIEDRAADGSIYPIELAAARVRAAVAAVRALPFPFTLTARCENFLAGRPDLDDTLRRLTAYRDAGADVLFAPGVSTVEQIRAQVALGAPVNVIMGGAEPRLTLTELSALGVKRISVGSGLFRTAYTALLRAAEEMQQRGVFTFAAGALPYGEFQRRLGS